MNEITVHRGDVRVERTPDNQYRVVGNVGGWREVTLATTKYRDMAESLVQILEISPGRWAGKKR